MKLSSLRKLGYIAVCGALLVFVLIWLAETQPWAFRLSGDRWEINIDNGKTRTTKYILFIPYSVIESTNAISAILTRKHGTAYHETWVPVSSSTFAKRSTPPYEYGAVAKIWSNLEVACLSDSLDKREVEATVVEFFNLLKRKQIAQSISAIDLQLKKWNF